MLLLYCITSFVPESSTFLSISCDLMTVTMICDYYILTLDSNLKKEKDLKIENRNEKRKQNRVYCLSLW